MNDDEFKKECTELFHKISNCLMEHPDAYVWSVTLCLALSRVINQQTEKQACLAQVMEAIRSQVEGSETD